MYRDTYARIRVHSEYMLLYLSMYMWETVIGSIFGSVHSPVLSCVTVITKRRLVLSVE